MKRTQLLLLLLAPVALGGCQTIRAHNPFRHREPEYKSAQQEQPLEVPPGMNQPPTENALAIPNVPAGAAAAPAAPAVQPEAAAPPAAEPEATAAAAAGTVQPVAQGAAVGDSLMFQDTPDSVYHRVGLALARGDVGAVTAHDATTRTYQVAVNTVVTEQPEGGFFHRLFHRSKSETVTGTVTVSIAPSGSGSVVEASGNPDAVARVMADLKQRLK